MASSNILHSYSIIPCFIFIEVREGLKVLKWVECILSGPDPVQGCTVLYCCVNSPVSSSDVTNHLFSLRKAEDEENIPGVRFC